MNINGIEDIYNVWNGKRFELTLRKVCRICFDGDDSVIPPELVPVADEVAAQVNMELLLGPAGTKILFDNRYDVPEGIEYVDEHIKDGVIFITPRVLKTAGGEIYPTIYAENPKESYIKLIRYLLSFFPMPTAGITGSAGKTTVTMLAHHALSEKYKVYNTVADGHNLNDCKSIGRRWIDRGNGSYNFYLQECGTGHGRVRDVIAMVDPEVFVINNIDPRQHREYIDSAEEIIADKLSYDETGREDGLVIVNKDDPYISAHKFKHKTMTYAVNDETADCVAKNIEMNGTMLELDLEFEGNTTRFKVDIPGKINAYNIAAAYLLAKHYGVTDEEIQRGFSNYHSRGIRQKLDRAGGKYLYVDCFNFPLDGLMASLETLEDLEIEEGGKRIAVISEKPSVNEGTYSNNVNAGKELARFDKIDKFIFLAQPDTPGAYSKEEYADAIYKSASSVIPGERIEQYASVEKIAEVLERETKRGDAILLKGTADSRLYRIFDMAYGTSYGVAFGTLMGTKGEAVSEGNVKGRYVKDLGGVNIYGMKARSATVLRIPEQIDGQRVVRLADKAFTNSHILNRVFMGKYIRSIGRRTFKGCKFLDKIYLPGSVKYVDTGAFEDCERLVYAGMTGVLHIGPGAFRGCKRLRKAVLTDTCGFISDTAFDGCPDLTIFAPEDSYAAGYAKRKNIRLEATDGDAEKGRITDDLDLSVKQGVADDRPDRISVIACGDVMAHDIQLEGALNQNSGQYSFDGYFTGIAALMGAADLKICNFETTTGPGEYMGYPKFNTPPALAEAIGKAGFDVAGCANNHSYDTGHEGLKGTVDVLEKNGVAVSGIKREAGERGYCIVEKKGIKIAVLNYTYRSESNEGKPTLNNNDIDEETFPLINSFCYETLGEDLERIKGSVDSARKDGADMVLVYYHWGREHEQKANIIQKYMAYETARMGVDAVIGSHPHVLQEMEILNIKGKEVPVYYSLGNYIWGRLPLPGRELSQNSCVATMEFEIDPQTKTVKGVRAGYEPLKIITGQTGDRFSFGVCDLGRLDEREKEEFSYNNTYTAEETIEQIRKSMNYSDNAVRCFDDVIEIEAGKRTDFSNYKVFANAAKGKEIVRLSSENCIVASVLQTGEVIGNGPGYTGITAYGKEGEKFLFVVKTVEGEGEEVPVLVDANNRITDTYRIYEYASGEEYLLPEACKVRPEAAKAWKEMALKAGSEGIELRCTANGMLTSWKQQYRTILYAEKNGYGAAAKRYMPQGHTEHNLGLALDIYSNGEGYMEWLKQHAHEYGFVVRMPKEGQEPLYVHARYYGDEIAGKLHEGNMSLEEYLMREVPEERKRRFFKK